MDYLTGVLKETLRIASPAPFTMNRLATQDYQIGDLTIKKGTAVSLGIQAIHFNPANYSKPYEFIPERFIPNKDPFPEDGCHKNPFSFLPFSSGPRNCIGQHVAMAKAKVMVGLLAKNFKFEMPKTFEMKMALKFLYESQQPITPNLIPV